LVLREQALLFNELLIRCYETLFSHVMAFFDDCIIYSKTWEELIKHVDDVLGKLSCAGFTVNTDKVQLDCTKVKLLGFIVSENSVKPDPEKLEAIKDFPVPKTAKDIQRFLGLCGVYRSYSKYFSIIAKP
jgi:hypothetical protein